MNAAIGYFGKLAARSDFVRSGAQHALGALLDAWVAATLTELASNARWKLHYDALPPLHFAFVGPTSRHVVAGHLLASGDLSGRRFPFIAMSALEVTQPHAFLPASPLALADTWRQLGRLAAGVHAADDPAGPLQALTAATVDSATVRGDHAGALAAFCSAYDIASLQAMLADDTRRHDVRGIVLGIGLLLQPCQSAGGRRLERSLALPLPREEALRPAVAAFWLALVAPFLRQRDIELALFMTDLRGAPQFLIGFGGATPGTLRAIIDPEFAAEQLITFDDTGWVGDAIGQDPAMSRLAACLAQDTLSLRACADLFHATFS
ncbi:type VI secretion system-associated protein TagF [Massilia sp. YMA4]|uniref:type VI secretion system-associated protein TagF n=1 Tax=Massilia sp. YMA4 TaxID=1593482 RepID=UPI000DD0F530|nr:type VI secretion system-associated protein TagF [Massilia sp. YMA4]AXA89905.1 type VI secretion system-associated protein TagF [Massilia sp. YMA4]